MYGMEELKIYNPIQKDYVTFLEMSHETQEKHTLLEVDLAPSGGVGLHYHKHYSETFEVIEGLLGVQIGKEIKYLKVGDTATALAGVRHRFFNDTKARCKFRCVVKPAVALKKYCKSDMDWRVMEKQIAKAYPKVHWFWGIWCG
jgi:quercetin dioxygenase-like cupin family protein